ncbi:hypothetical protein fugu_017445 [Takifugu bimaculatus]|uniref:Uncharacterized protein n=1 Tax=Takifugu bimaculatus TaxID=433685 RepID=A0A4Z2BSY2_9TELE|nr:hypothetical protein fugu_017445 [Takifugu bimaculatus]
MPATGCQPTRPPGQFLQPLTLLQRHQHRQRSARGHHLVPLCRDLRQERRQRLTPCLYVGTSLGTILGLVLTVPPAGEQRQLQSVIVSPIGMLVRLKGTLLRMAFLDSSGSLLPHTYEPWYETNTTADGEEREKVRKRRPVSVSPSMSQDLHESQYAVICSEKQAKVMSLPSQACIYKHNITGDLLHPEG